MFTDLTLFRLYDILKNKRNVIRSRDLDSDGNVIRSRDLDSDGNKNSISQKVITDPVLVFVCL
jgi:hypothetical protein